MGSMASGWVRSMLVIYNLPGLLLGVASAAAGVIVLMVTGWFAPALVVIGILWLAFGRARVDPKTGVRRPAPSLFYVPMFYLGFPVLLLAVPAAITDVQRGSKAKDPRFLEFKDDERALARSPITGDPDLARAAIEGLKPAVSVDKVAVLSKARGDALLVLVKVPALKDVDKARRPALLESLRSAIKAQPAVEGRRLYLGIQGRIAYGIVQSPSGLEIGEIVSTDPLLDFYGPPPGRGEAGPKP